MKVITEQDTEQGKRKEKYRVGREREARKAQQKYA